MSADSWAVRWVVVLAQLETAVAEGEQLVEQGRVEEFRAFSVPVLEAGMPPELADRARSLHERLAALTVRVAEAMASTRQEIQAVTDRAERTDRTGHGDRTDRNVRRQWQPAFVDARA